jgi:hypothetical protein
MVTVRAICGSARGRGTAVIVERTASPTTNTRASSTTKGSASATRKTRFKSESIYLGSFDMAVETALTYDQKTVELHGQFTHLNFPMAEGWGSNK